MILIPSSTCAVSGLSEILWTKTSCSQRVLTKVVRPVPEAPVMIGHKVRKRDENWSLVIPVVARGRKEIRLHTDDHKSELNTLLNLISSASACERHFCERAEERTSWCCRESNEDEKSKYSRWVCIYPWNSDMWRDQTRRVRVCNFKYLCKDNQIQIYGSALLIHPLCHILYKIFLPVLPLLLSSRVD